MQIGLDATIQVFKRSFYVDEIYWTLFGVPLKTLSKTIDAVLEPKVFDGLIRALTFATQKVASLLQLFQSGEIRSYVAWMAVGAVFLILYLIV